MKFKNLKIENSWLKLGVFATILALYASFLIYKENLPAANDMVEHVKSGELILQGQFKIIFSNFYSYTEPNHFFVNRNWLSQVIFYLLYKIIGWGGMVILKVLILLSSFSFIFLSAIKKANFWLVTFFSIPTVLILTERTSLRPETFSYLFVAIFIYLLFDLEEHPESRKIYWLIPLQLLWVNMHIFFIFGIGLVGAFLLEKIFLNYKNLKNYWGNPLIKKLIIVFVLMIFVSFLNPFGVKGVLYPFQILHDVGIQTSENLSLLNIKKTITPQDDILVFLFPTLVSVFFLSFLFNFRKKPTFLFFAGVATAVGGFMMIRLLSIFGLIFLPAISYNLKDQLQFFVVFIKKQSIFLIKTIVFIVILVSGSLYYFVLVSAHDQIYKYHEFGVGFTSDSNRAAEFYKAQNLKGPIFNDFDIGSYLIYSLYPKENVFVDNRPEAYSEDFFKNTYLPMLSNENVWYQTLAKYNFQTIFFFQYDEGVGILQFLYHRMSDPMWVLVYVDKYNVIFVRNSEENKDIINKFSITGNNIEERLANLKKSTDIDDELAFADTAYPLGRTDLAEETYLKVVERWPKSEKVWMVLGELELSKDNQNSNVLGIDYLQKAINLGQKTAEAYSFLGLAYYRTGQTEEAKQALQKSISINPERIDARNMLYNIENQ